MSEKSVNVMLLHTEGNKYAKLEFAQFTELAELLQTDDLMPGVIDKRGVVNLTMGDGSLIKVVGMMVYGSEINSYSRVIMFGENKEVTA